MGTQFTMTRGIATDLLMQAGKAVDEEVCGLLLGVGTHISAILPAANVHATPARFFEIDPAVLISATRAARLGGEQVLGCYHSHPSGVAAPSATDAAMGARDGKLWAIVADGTIGWWRDGADGFEALSSPAQRG
jgi:proteasome lid subunit RPN8/RPN11